MHSDLGTSQNCPLFLHALTAMESSGMDAQRTLFPLAFELHPRDPHVTPQDKPRLTGQNAEILARLQHGPATNVQLAGISLKYTSRISDLRAAGYKVTCERMRNGVTIYRLEPTP